MNKIIQNSFKFKMSILKQMLKRGTYKLLINLIPVRQKRHELRKSLPALYIQGNKKLDRTPQKTFFLVTNNTSNLGDLYSCPALYFNISPEQEVYDIVNTFNSKNKILKNDKLIIGGGIHPWLFNNQIFYKSLKGNSNIAWGIGTYKGDIYNNDIVDKFSLIGLRDFNHPQIDGKKIRYVPCPSCFMNELSINYPIKNKIAFYLHSQINSPIIDNIKCNYPYMDNYTYNIAKVIEFLGSAEYIISNSFHGVYWATLLGKKVICIPPDNKFYGYKYPPVFATFETWEHKINDAHSYPEALKDCRKVNLEFYKTVREVING